MSFTICAEGVGCTFQWKESLTPSITAREVTEHKLSMLGTGLPVDASKIEVRIGGVLQSAVSKPAANQIDVVISELNSWESEMTLQVRADNEGYAKM